MNSIREISLFNIDLSKDMPYEEIDDGIALGSSEPNPSYLSEAQLKEIRRRNKRTGYGPEIERVHKTLSFADKQTASAHRIAFILAKGDTKKRRKAQRHSEKWAGYLVDVGKLKAEDEPILMSYLCPI